MQRMILPFRLHGRVVLTCLLFLVVQSAVAQVAIRGQVLDGDLGDPIFSANVLVKGTTKGVTTDFDGRFRIDVAALPTTLLVSFIGYQTREIPVADASAELEIKLSADQILIDAAEVVGDRISEKQKQAPLTVESMDVLAIKEAPSGNFYEGLGNLKGVDVTSASLGFKIINTRGFNSTSPVRSLQLIDGIDNQSPGLNFSLGNFLGASDLDVKSVDIVAGASSAFYGPGAFNGVVSMETKSPYQFPGIAFSAKSGERNLNEIALRYADFTVNDNGHPVVGFKVNAFRFSADDWQATNEDPVEGSLFGTTNAGGFDAVNVYGDEYRPVFDFSGDNSTNARGLGGFFRTGYREADLVDYGTENLKLSTAIHWRLDPDATYESPELVYGFSSGFGTTVYQGDNRFSLRDIEFYQHKVELKKPGKWFLRGYRTSEDAGNSFDPYATALRLQEETRSDYNYSKVYYRYWVDSIVPGINQTWPDLVQIGVDPDFGFPIFGYEDGAIENWYAANQDSLFIWHDMVEAWTNAGYAGLGDVATEPLGHLTPGTPEFQEAFDRITSSKNNDEERGTRFFDRSSLVHLHGEYVFEPSFADELRVGANFRRYTPNSDGTIFSDTAGVVITNSEFGAYAGMNKRLMEDKMIATATLRADKNQNFDWVFSPAASLVYKPAENDYFRLSFSSALRNPTLADQYLFLDVGPATLVGNLNGATDRVDLESFVNYRNSISTANGLPFGNLDTLEYFDIAPLRPEQVRTIEAGYRTTLGEKVYMDAGYYFSRYNHFIGYNIGLDVLFENEDFQNAVTGVDVYRYAANSVNEVTTQGFSIGLNYYIDNQFMLAGNYSWNQLLKAEEDDPIIPAFNTPEHKFNVSFSARDLKLKGRSTWGFGLNYKWVEGFLFEGSPQFTGFVPTFDLLDAQISANIERLHTTFKVGGSNLLSNIHIETYGGPSVGRLMYVSAVYDFNHRK
ncbi:MAG: TonB-dependent receptor [Flavobacteriales bacterium]